ncbi:MAG: hypothetical protein DYG94_05350 [Leptolyngbya sp. PLA3]|nr:MAG: hypothetical protein EDM82_04770 [Cyanobacteria bacterium CYA]MCE7968160.1 hypothetical protein [Leptolyngbya sp. PL-A3]
MLKPGRWLLWVLWLLACRSAGGFAHPQDGPHADIRISIDESGVHVGMMINLAFIDETVAFPRESPTAVADVEEDQLRLLLTEFFERRNVVEIDGVVVAPIVRDFEMIRPGVENLPLFPLSGMRGLLRARVDLEYPGKAMPRRVRFVWDSYPLDVLTELPEGTPRPPMAVEAQLLAEGTVDILRFTKEEPEVTWHGTGLTREERFLEVPEPAPPPKAKFPLLSLGTAVGGLVLALAGVQRIGPREGIGRRSPGAVLLACGALLLAAAPVLRQVGTVSMGGGERLPTEAEAKAIFEPLHANIYRAFDYEQRGAIYDALARSVDGPLLESLYDQIYTSLVMYEEGGAVSRVSAVRLMRVDIRSIGVAGDPARPTFTLEAQWQVDGVVYHYGHSHRRTNEYVAEYSVGLGEAGWRITGNRVLSQERLDPQTGAKPALPVPDGEI